MTPDPDQGGEVKAGMFRSDSETEEEEDSSPAPPAVMEMFAHQLVLSRPQLRYDQSSQYLADLQATPRILIPPINLIQALPHLALLHENI